MRKSPFVQLKEAIESEIYDTKLKIEYVHYSTGVEIADPYFIGYKEALERMLQRAEGIYKRER